MQPEFLEFPKMARLSRECIISEKIDGTNAQIYIKELEGYPEPPESGVIYQNDGLAIFAGSRNRWITPENDNYGFAAWVKQNGEQLINLGPGRHFGEWWGQGIQRKYGMDKKVFSMFNTIRWCEYGNEPQVIPSQDPKAEPKYQQVLPKCCRLVPVLWRGEFASFAVESAIRQLEKEGSLAAPGFGKPEGIVIYHVAAGVGFKKTIENDHLPKSKK